MIKKRKREKEKRRKIKTCIGRAGINFSVSTFDCLICLSAINTATGEQ